MSNQKNIVENNSEILFLYDAKLTNPNGDPDDENRPRMDYDRNIVTDLRLKRYIRDYIKSPDNQIFVDTVAGESGDKPVTAAERIDAIFEEDLGKMVNAEQVDQILDTLADIRLFGAVIPDKEFEAGGNLRFTGPVQFSWGYSLNAVEPLLTSSITGKFVTKTKKGESGETETERAGGAMGRDYRLRYSFLAFHGTVAARNAKRTKLTEEDLGLLEEALINGIQAGVTHSKTGQSPRLMMKVEYEDDKTFLGDLRDYICLEEREKLISIQNVKLNATKLAQRLKANRQKIAKVHFAQSDLLTTTGLEDKDLKVSLEAIFGDKFVDLGTL